jgi:hypothetical protein
VVTADALGTRTGGADPTDILSHFNEQTDKALKELAGGAVTSLNNLSKAFGGAADFAALTKFTADGQDPSFGAFAVTRNGAPVASIAATAPNDAKAYTSNSDEAFKAFAGDVGDTVRRTLDAIDLPAWAKDMLGKLGSDADLDKINETINQIVATKAQIADLRDGMRLLGVSFGDLATISDESLLALSEASGGLDVLKSGLKNYYGAFYDDGERAKLQLKGVGEELRRYGIETIPESIKAFRDLVEQQDLSKDADVQRYAALIRVSGAFAELTEQAGGAARSVEDLAREQYDLTTQLLRLQGDTKTLRERELARLGTQEAKDTQLQIWALEDAADANRAYTDSLKEVAKAATIAGQVQGPGGQTLSETDFLAQKRGVSLDDIKAAIAGTPDQAGAILKANLDVGSPVFLSAVANSIALARAAAAQAPDPVRQLGGTT